MLVGGNPGGRRHFSATGRAVRGTQKSRKVGKRKLNSASLRKCPCGAKSRKERASLCNWAAGYWSTVLADRRADGAVLVPPRITTPP